MLLPKAVVILLVPALAFARPDLDELVRTLDRLYRSGDSNADMAMQIVTPNWQRTLEMEAWSKGTDRTFVRVLSPPREAGSATLRIGDEIWNYLPNTGSTVRVPPSMMSGSWMGSDITNNDIVREITYAEDYTYSYIDDPDPAWNEEGAVYIELVPKGSAAVVWSRIVAAVRTMDIIPLWERYYDGRGELIRTVVFSEVRDMDGRAIPTRMEVFPADEEGSSTTVTWSRVEFDRGVSDDIFTLRNLQSAAGR